MYEEDYFDWQQRSPLLDNKDKKMDNGLFKLTRENFNSAVVYGVLFGVVDVITYMVQVGDVFKLDWHILVNSFVFGLLAFALSLIKNLLTTNSGNFMGVTKVIPKTETEIM